MKVSKSWVSWFELYTWDVAWKYVWCFRELLEKKSVRYCQTFWSWGFGIMHHHINSIAQSWKKHFFRFFSSEESHYRLRRKKDVWKISEEMKKMMMLWMTVQFFLSKSDKKLFSRKMKIWCKMGLQKCHLFCLENQSKRLQTVYFFFLTFLFKLL